MGQVKIPVIVTSSIICLAIGAAGGVFAMTMFGYSLKGPRLEGPPPGPPGGMPPGVMPPGAMFGKMPFGKPDPKNLLASLIVKIDQLSQKPLKIDLNKDQQKRVLEQLKGLSEQMELSEEEAQDRLKSLVEILKDHMNILEAGGFQMPGDKMGEFPNPNPLMEEKTQKHLQSLQKAFGQGKSK